jgi:tripartite-type tricarboxylate transporter receptor subunit TctC
MRKHRSLTALFAVLSLAAALSAWAGAQTEAPAGQPAAGAKAVQYPTRAINFLIPFGAGSSADLMGRALASAAEKVLGQPVVPVNKPGAAGGIMYTALHSSAPDGYTLGWNSTSVLTTALAGNVPYKWDDYEHVCRIGYTSMPIAVRADAPWKTLGDLVAWAKKNPGKLKIANAGSGSGTHMTAVNFALVAGIDVVHVPLGAERRIPSLLGGEVEAVCLPLPEVAPQVEAGQARILGIPSHERDPKFKDVPTFAEAGYPFEMDLFRGISAPKGTPAEIVRKLEDAFRKAAGSEEFRKAAAQDGFLVSFQPQAQFQKYLEEQYVLVEKAMKQGGLTK